MGGFVLLVDLVGPKWFSAAGKSKGEASSGERSTCHVDMELHCRGSGLGAGKRMGGRIWRNVAKIKAIQEERVLVRDHSLPIMNNSFADQELPRRKRGRRWSKEEEKRERKTEEQRRGGGKEGERKERVKQKSWYEPYDTRKSDTRPTTPDRARESSPAPCRR